MEENRNLKLEIETLKAEMEKVALSNKEKQKKKHNVLDILGKRTKATLSDGVSEFASSLSFFAFFLSFLFFFITVFGLSEWI